MKTLSTLETLKVLLSHERLMAGVVREIDQRGEPFISEALLLEQSVRYMRHLEPTEKKRLQTALNIKSLLACHVLADRDVHEGVSRLTFNDTVIQLFRLVDASLHQELTSAKLTSELSALWDLRRRFDSGHMSFSERDPDYTEHCHLLFEKLGQLLSTLKRSIGRMQQLRSELENLSADACREENFQAQRQVFIDKISHLFNRHIEPTLQFLNSKVRLKDGDNLFETLAALREIFERHDQSGRAMQILRYDLSLSNLFTPISQVARQVDQFLRKSRRSLQQYNAVEHKFQQLLAALEETQDGDLRKTRIRGGFTTEFVTGLRGFKGPREFAFVDSPAWHRNMLSEITARTADLALYEERPTDLVASVDDSLVRRAAREALVRALIPKLHLRPTRDLTLLLHHRLKDQLEGYQLLDLFEALQFMPRVEGWQLQRTNRRVYLNHDEQAYVYKRILIQLAEGGRR